MVATSTLAVTERARVQLVLVQEPQRAHAAMPAGGQEPEPALLA